MIWIFEREEDSLRLETRLDNDAAEFVLSMHRPNEGKEVEDRHRDQPQTRLTP